MWVDFGDRCCLCNWETLDSSLVKLAGGAVGGNERASGTVGGEAKVFNILFPIEIQITSLFLG